MMNHKTRAGEIQLRTYQLAACVGGRLLVITRFASNWPHQLSSHLVLILKRPQLIDFRLELSQSPFPLGNENR